jgi:predicted S18 family serine protease
MLFACNKNGKTNTPQDEQKDKVEYMSSDTGEEGVLVVSVYSISKDQNTEVSEKIMKFKVNKVKNKAFELDFGKVQVDDETKAVIYSSAFNAALALGKKLDEYKIEVSGFTKFPTLDSKAGITATIMAGMNGVKIDNLLSLTGSINPDGTIGPATNLPAKLRAAIAAGKNTFAYPAGQKMAFDQATKSYVDIFKIADQNKIKLIPIYTIYDAFIALTGKTVELPKPLSDKELELSEQLKGQLTGISANWHTLAAQFNKKYDQLSTKPSQKTQNWKKVSNSYSQESKKILKSGMVSAGYDYAQRGGAFAFTSFWSKRFDQLSAKKNLKKLLGVVEEFNKLSENIKTAMSNLQKIKPESRGDLLALISAWEQLVGAWSYASQGIEIQKQVIEKINYLLKNKLDPSMDENRLFKMLDNTILKYSLAKLKTLKAADFAKLIGVKGPKYIIQIPEFQKLNTNLEKLAKGQLTLIKKYFLKKNIGHIPGKNEEEIHSNLINQNNNYLQAIKSVEMTNKIDSKEDFQKYLAQIAAYSNSYFNSSMLMMKHNFLKIKKSANKNDVEIKHKQYLKTILESAVQNTKIQAALAKKYAGVIPASAKLFYNIGLSMKEQNYSLQIKSLEMFWKASFECQLAILLAN